MSGRMIRELSRQQPDLGDADLAGRLVGRAQTYYQAVEHASQTGAFRREAERMGAGSVHICVYHAFVSLHPSDKQAQNAFFTRLVSAAALPKTTFQQGVRDLQLLLSKSHLDATPTRSRSSAQSSSAHSTPRRTLRTPGSAGTPESAQASARKLLDPKYLSALQAGASDPSSPASPSKAPTSATRRRAATPSTPGTPSAARRPVRTPGRSTSPRRSPPPAASPAPPALSRSPRDQVSGGIMEGGTPGKRKLPAWGEEDEMEDADQTVRLTSPQQRAKVRAALQGAAADPVDDDDDDDDDDDKAAAQDEEQELQEEEEEAEEAEVVEGGVPVAKETMSGPKQQLLYAASMFRQPLQLVPGMDQQNDAVAETRWPLLAALLPHSLPGRPRHRPVLAVSSADWLAPWEDALLVARERREAGAPAWMTELDYTRSPALPPHARADLKRWLHRGAQT